LALFSRKLSQKSRNEPENELDLIVKQQGIISCALFDAEGRIAFSRTGVGADDRELKACHEHIRQICELSNLWLGPDQGFENIDLHSTTGEFIIWDFGHFLFAVVGKDIKDIAYLRLRVNILKNSIASSDKLKKYKAAVKAQPAGSRLPQDKQPLVAILQKGTVANEQS